MYLKKTVLSFLSLFGFYIGAMDPLTDKAISHKQYLKAIEIKKWFDSREKSEVSKKGLYYLMDAIYNKMPIPTFIYECLTFSRLSPREEDTRFVVKCMLKKNSQTNELEIDTDIIKSYENAQPKKKEPTNQIKKVKAKSPYKNKRRSYVRFPK